MDTRIIELPEAQELAEEDYMAIDNEERGSKKFNFYNQVQELKEIASGASTTYAISIEDNPTFDSQDKELNVTLPIIDINGNEISNLKVNDNINIIELNVPDRWVAEVSETTARVFALETAKEKVQDVQFNNVTLLVNGIAKIGYKATVLLTAAGWNNYSQEVNVSGVAQDNAVVVTPAPASISKYVEHGIVCVSQSAGKLLFTCGVTPSQDIQINVLMIGG